MKLNKNYSAVMVGIVSALVGSQGFAGAMGPAATCETGKAYIGVFGGAGASTHSNTSLFGTAFFTEAEGGPLAVDAFGRTNDRSVGMVGGQLGYQWQEIVLSSFGSVSGFSPAVELEGYYVGKSSFTGHDINNNTARLPEHDFLVTLPTKAGVFMTNAVANLNLTNYNRFHPYLGAGIGAAVLSISGADSTQESPPEAGVNHFNASNSDKDATFAAQIKAGLNFDVNKNVNIFAEYRWLHVASTDFVFGSTVYPAHAATSSWNVNLGDHNYNMGAIGVRFSA